MSHKAVFVTGTDWKLLSPATPAAYREHEERLRLRMLLQSLTRQTPECTALIRITKEPVT